MGDDERYGGQPRPAFPGRLVVRRPAVPAVGTIYDWFELRARQEGVAGPAAIATGAAFLTAERVFYLPWIDEATPIREGFAPLDWEGYHAGKHGVYERFLNLRGAYHEVNMGELFFGERYRWIRPEFREDPNLLRYITESQCRAALETAYSDSLPAAERFKMIGIFDSPRFTQDIADIYQRWANNPRSTIWQGRYLTRSGPDPLQTNIDFEANGHNWRLAADARTGRILNFFKIVETAERPRMQYVETRLLWQGNITDVRRYTAPGSTLTVNVAATWRGLFMQGMKGGAYAGALASAFLGAISGFRQEGIPGALKGLAIGGLVGAGVGALFGGVAMLLQRIFPWVGRALTVVGAVLTFASVTLDASETHRDPQEFHHPEEDDDGNTWAIRNVESRGILLPDRTPHGLRVQTSDGAVFEFGENEAAGESSYDSTPITVFNDPYARLNWQMMRTPDGSSMWYWHNLDTGKERIVAFRDDEAMRHAFDQERRERGYSFVPTRN